MIERSLAEQSQLDQSQEGIGHTSDLSVPPGSVGGRYRTLLARTGRCCCDNTAIPQATMDFVDLKVTRPINQTTILECKFTPLDFCFLSTFHCVPLSSELMYIKIQDLSRWQLVE